MLMTKKDFVNYLSENYDMTKAEAKNIIDTFTDGVACALSGGHDINLTGFGKFSVVDIEARERRNPQTGEVMMVEAHKVPKFKFASNVKADLR